MPSQHWIPWFTRKQERHTQAGADGGMSAITPKFRASRSCWYRRRNRAAILRLSLAKEAIAIAAITQYAVIRATLRAMCQGTRAYRYSTIARSMICFRSRISSWWLVPSAFASSSVTLQDKRVACQEEAVGLRRYDEHVGFAYVLVFGHGQQIVGDVLCALLSGIGRP